MTARSLKASPKSIIILIVGALALFAVDVAIYVVSSGSLARSRAELAAREEQVENSRKIAQRLEHSRNCYVEASSQLRDLESSVSPAAYIPTLLKQLEATGAQVNLKVLSVRPRLKPVALPNSAADSSEAKSGSPKGKAGAAAKKEEPKTYDTILIDIEVEGAYWDTMRFLQRLTEFPKILAVDSIQIIPTARSTQVDKSPLLTVKLSVRAFVFPEDAGMAPEVIIRPIAPVEGPVPSDVKVSVRKWRSEHEAG